MNPLIVLELMIVLVFSVFLVIQLLEKKFITAMISVIPFLLIIIFIKSL